jgi:glutamate 5-kinase
VRGSFLPGDAVSVVSLDGAEIACGLARVSAGDAARLAGRRREDDEGPEEGFVLVHRGDLVVLPPE